MLGLFTTVYHNEYNVHKGEKKKNQLGFSQHSGFIIGLIPQSLWCMRVKLSVVILWRLSSLAACPTESAIVRHA